MMLIVNLMHVSRNALVGEWNWYGWFKVNFIKFRHRRTDSALVKCTIVAHTNWQKTLEL